MRQRTALGLCMMLSSFFFFGAGAYVVDSAMDQQVQAERQKAATTRQCVNLLQTLPSSTVAMQGEEITVVMRDITEPRKALTDATVAALMCPGKTFTEVCLGDKCQGSQDNVILRIKMEGQ